jgi:hypothetical protein
MAMASDTAIKKSKPQRVSISKRKLAETAKVMEGAAIVAAIEGEQQAIQGADKLKAAKVKEAVGNEYVIQGATKITRAADEKAVSERMAVLSDVVATAGVVDIAEGAEMLAASEDVGVLSALVGMMGRGDIDHGLELARLSGELFTVRDMVEALKMPVLADFLTDRAARLHAMSVEQIRIAMSADGLSKVLAATGKKIGTLGENEVEEGMVRLSTSAAVANESEALAKSSDDLAVKGLAEVVIGEEVAQEARDEALQGTADISSGSAVMGAALAMDDMANELKKKSE